MSRLINRHRRFLLCALAASYIAVAAAAAPGRGDSRHSDLPAGGDSVAGEPAAPYVVAVFGDSQAQGVFGGLYRMLIADRSIRVLDRAKAGTGLTQPLTFDWPATIQKFVEDEHADVAVVMVGANDRLPMWLEGHKPSLFRSTAWRTAYEDRVTRMATALTGAGVHVIWVGMPLARDEQYSSDMAYLNSLVQEALPADNAEFLPLWTVVADENGRFSVSGKAVDGEIRPLRGVDGIHFTSAGYDVVARQVYRVIEAWRAQTVAAAPAAKDALAATDALPVKREK